MQETRQKNSWACLIQTMTYLDNRDSVPRVYLTQYKLDLNLSA